MTSPCVSPSEPAEPASATGSPRSSGSPSLRALGLCPRHAAILDLVCAGYSNKQIAHERGVSAQTVKNDLSEIYSTLGARNRTQAGVIWWRLTQHNNPATDGGAGDGSV